MISSLHRATVATCRQEAISALLKLRNWKVLLNKLSTLMNHRKIHLKPGRTIIINVSSLPFCKNHCAVCIAAEQLLAIRLPSAWQAWMNTIHSTAPLIFLDRKRSMTFDSCDLNYANSSVLFCSMCVCVCVMLFVCVHAYCTSFDAVVVWWKCSHAWNKHWHATDAVANEEAPNGLGSIGIEWQWQRQ